MIVTTACGDLLCDIDDPLHGWIWVDSQHRGDFRHTILTHEIGHALGLNHNLCHSSVMS